MAGFTISIGPGELVDRWSILRLKQKNAPTAELQERFARECATLAQAFAHVSDVVGPRAERLAAINAELWEVEDGIRRLAAAGRFDGSFVDLARRVPVLNDARAALKREIDGALGYAFPEVKIHDLG